MSGYDVDQVLAMYTPGVHPYGAIVRALHAERTWSADGERELYRVPATRIRFVPVYDAVRTIAEGRVVQVGTIAEPY